MSSLLLLPRHQGTETILKTEDREGLLWFGSRRHLSNVLFGLVSLVKAAAWPKRVGIGFQSIKQRFLKRYVQIIFFLAGSDFFKKSDLPVFFQRTIIVNIHKHFCYFHSICPAAFCIPLPVCAWSVGFLCQHYVCNVVMFIKSPKKHN